MVSNEQNKASLRGVGVGLRHPHLTAILDNPGALPWFEILSDNYLVPGGPNLQILDTIRQDYPIAMHGVALSIGSNDPLNKAYLTKLKNLAARCEPAIISDHCCFVSHGGHYHPDLLPLPYTEEVLEHCRARILQIQDFLGRRILLENVSSYLTYQASDMTEAEFMAELAIRADCDLLVDINNIYVSAKNHKFNPIEYINTLPTSRVKQIHLAGFTDMKDYLLDSHGSEVAPPVWDLYDYALKQFGAVPTLIEWDNDLPDFEVLLNQAKLAESYMEKINAPELV